MGIVEYEDGFKLFYKDMEIIRHSNKEPLIYLGYGDANFKLNHGTFKVKDKVNKKIALDNYTIEKTDDLIKIYFNSSENDIKITVTIEKQQNGLKIMFSDYDSDINRFWFKLKGYDDEHIYGCGEQFSEFDVKGKEATIWLSEHHKMKRLIQKSIRRKLGINKDIKRPFEDYVTYYCSPSFVSSKCYHVYIKNNSYMKLNFKEKKYNQLYSFKIPDEIFITKENDFEQLLEKVTEITGRQSELPNWIYEGAILGIQGGTDIVLDKIKHCKEKGVEINAVWCQDWEGRRITSFGKQLMWNWKWDEELYPKLDEEVENLKHQNIGFMGYINPFLAIEGELYREASAKGYTVKTKEGKDYLVTITTFPAAMIDLTNPKAFTWIKEVIKKNMIDFGLCGWMADFGEYLPVDGVLYGGKISENAHNDWPVLWAKANREAIEEAGKEGEIVFFTRAGFHNTPKYSTLIWTGDQHVDWSMDDGLASVIPATLSLAMCGGALVHSDIGGYTTLPGITRTKELFMRWSEMSAFSPIMRTHEGNRPDDNWQFDSDDETLTHFARMSKIHKLLAPYLKECVEQASQRGLPVMRPLFMYYDEEKSYNIKYQYLLGRKILVAPIIKKQTTIANVYLPNDKWIHLWTGEEYLGGRYITIRSEIGYPPVFYKKEGLPNSLKCCLDEIKKI